MITKNPSVVIAATLAAVAFSSSLLFAQAPEGAAASMTGNSSLRAEGNSARGIGAGYRATFGAEAFTYTPALGSEAPQTMPWRFELHSVLRGGEPVRSGNELAEASVAVRGHRCDLDRGQGMIERYDVRDDGVEQSFVFDAVPGSGDLVVRGAVSTALRADPVTGASRIDFLSKPYGGVRISKVVGIDATGWRHPGTMNWDGEHLELVLPATFMDRATFPIVLDPLVGNSQGIGFSTSDARDPEVAFSSDINRYLCVWERHFSVTDIEIRGRLRNASNGSASSIFSITSGSGVRNTDPQVCSVAGTDRFIVAWQAGPSVFGPFDILGCAVDGSANVSATNPLTAVFVAGSFVTTPESEIRPCLAGDPEGNDELAVLAYELPGQGIATRTLFINTAGTVTAAPTPALVVNDATATRPALSPATNDNVVLAYQIYASGKDTIAARRLGTNGVPNGNAVSWVSVGATFRTPDVSGDGSSYRIICEREWAVGENDIVCANVSWNANGTATPSFIMPVIVQTSADERHPRIAFCGTKYVVSWSSLVSTLSYERLVRGISTANSCDPCGPTTALSRTRATEMYGAIASEQEGGDLTDDRALVLYTSAEISLSPVSDVRGQLFNAMIGSVGVEFASGCGLPTGLFRASGTFAIGSNNFEFGASHQNSAPQICLFNFGVTQQTTTCGCTVVLPDIIVPVIMVGGLVTYPLVLPCDPALDGFAMKVQTAVLTTGYNGPCFLLPEASFSAPEDWTLGY